MTFMVVDMNGYDVLLGLDFLMKIGAVVDVERGLIQVRHGPGTNVEVLPLTVVNLLQRMSAGTMVRETSTIWKDARAHQDGYAVPDQDRKAVNEEDDASTSYSDDGKFVSSNHSESGNMWKEIYEQIKIDTDLGERGQ